MLGARKVYCQLMTQLPCRAPRKKYRYFGGFREAINRPALVVEGQKISNRSLQRAGSRGPPDSRSIQRAIPATGCGT